MTRRIGIGVLLVLVGAALGGGAATGGTQAPAGAYHLARADQRLCPSPLCGGIWVTRVNTSRTICGDGTRRLECYAARADLSRLPGDRPALQRLVSEGKALARGRLVRGLVDGFPELDVLVVSEVWVASSSQNPARGAFLRLRDNGVRCVTTPCYSVRATTLNRGRSVDVSDVDLRPSGAPPPEQRRALGEMAKRGLLVAGRIVGTKRGRTAAAFQLYSRATP